MLRLVLTVALAAATHAANIVVIGDSWGDEGRNDFEKVVSTHSNKTVFNGAISGSTAQQWLDNIGNGYLKKWVSEPDVETVWVTLGGNDAQWLLPGCGLQGRTPENCTDMVIQNVTSIFNNLFGFIHSANPKARIVGFGYDILGFGKNTGCKIDAEWLFPACKMDPTCINTQFVKLQHNLWEPLASKLPYVDTVNLLGTLQTDGNVSGAAIGKPVISQWSPEVLIQSDCIHPTIGAGFVDIFTAFWDLYFAKL
eukprot:TRINITY_DN8121_c1_g1_i1.p1 TRINITY_DN8121_c1_g1~~TRINITY_DN8121_c1_g1_i1.p1  ORF type:complete len:253 (+),score=54.39 TRINITY_DN8121_c1_g1_i1:44-802(+)